MEGVPWAYEKISISVQLWTGGSGLDGGGATVRTIVCVDKLRRNESLPQEEYVRRMRRGVEEAVEKGLLKDWAERVIGKFLSLKGPSSA